MKMTALVGSLIIIVSAVPCYSVTFAQEKVEKAFTVGGERPRECGRCRTTAGRAAGGGPPERPEAIWWPSRS